jgi:ferritin-like metal-binding protein YciE
MELATLKDLMVEQLRDLYSAETQLTEALPKMMRAATHPELKNSFSEHLEVTKRQRDDVATLIRQYGANPEGHECQAMKGIIKEGEELIAKRRDADSDVMDAGLIAAAQRVEHYEIAGYGTVCAYAVQLGDQQAAMVLDKIAKEEGTTDHKLTALALRVINPAAEA